MTPVAHCVFCFRVFRNVLYDNKLCRMHRHMLEYDCCPSIKRYTNTTCSACRRTGQCYSRRYILIRFKIIPSRWLVVRTRDKHRKTTPNRSLLTVYMMHTYNTGCFILIYNFMKSRFSTKNTVSSYSSILSQSMHTNAVAVDFSLDEITCMTHSLHNTFTHNS